MITGIEKLWQSFNSANHGSDSQNLAHISDSLQPDER